MSTLRGERDGLHAAALWTTTLASVVLLGAAGERWYFSGYSRSQEASKARALDALVRVLPIAPVRRQLLLKDVKIFLRDVGQWSQATVAVRFVLPAVSAEGASFWIIRTAPISLRDFLWSKFRTGFVPVFVLTEGLTIVANEVLGVDPSSK